MPLFLSIVIAKPMSEFLFYDFRAIDQPLSPKEQKEVSAWSSRAKVSARKAVFTYAYGDFTVKPLVAIEKYFDSLLYWASWGNKKLIFRFPLTAINLEVLESFSFTLTSYDLGFDYGIKIHVRPHHVLLEFYTTNEDEEDYVDEAGKEMDQFTQIREAILTEDYRCLFLFWLHLAQTLEEHNPKLIPNFTLPTIPSGLKNLSAELETFVDFFGIDRFLIRAAGHFSPEPIAIENAFAQALTQLPESEKDEWLLRLAAQEPRLDRQFKNRLASFLQKEDAAATSTEKVQLADILALAKTKPKNY